MVNRVSWDQYFMEIAEKVSSRSTCDRAHVGAVLVRDKQIVATGYNGSPPGHKHCDDHGHLMEGNHCVRTVHAELNSLLQAARKGHATEGSVIYVTHTPCYNCTKALLTAGVREVMYKEERGDSGLSRILAAQSGVLFHRVIY